MVFRRLGAGAVLEGCTPLYQLAKLGDEFASLAHRHDDGAAKTTSKTPPFGMDARVASSQLYSIMRRVGMSAWTFGYWLLFVCVTLSYCKIYTTRDKQK